MTTEVIELSPGRGGGANDVQARSDWSPTAQRPDRHGVMAHTPDPAAYHRSADGRTVLPRATKHGASRAFDSSRPGLLNIDPADPVTGQGGTLVDVEALRKDEKLLQKAADLAEGDPAIAWDLITAGRAKIKQAPVREAPPMSGYLVPSSSPGGRQVTGAGNFAAGIVAPGTTTMGTTVQPVVVGSLINPAIHHKEKTMEPPQQVPVEPPIPAADQGSTTAVAPVQPPQPVQTAFPASQSPAEPQVDTTQLVILQALQGLTKAVETLGSPTPSQGDEAVKVKAMQQEEKTAKLLANAEQDVDAVAMMEAYKQSRGGPELSDSQTSQLSASEKQMDTSLFGLSWLQPIPQRPQIKVLFDLGPGGQHLKRFHHVEFTQDLVVLVYDDRYEGDRFHPPSTPAGQPIQVTFPDRENVTYHVLVPPKPRLNFAIGCMDILELIITEAPENVPRPHEQQTDAELRAWRDEIPTRWSGQEASLEQAIRAGQFDAGAGAVV